MSKVSTDKQLIEEVISRSIAEILPSKDDFKKLLESGERLKIYIGADATGPALHLGHATNYMVLERLRRLGHEVVVLIGDFTARIGDPTDKTAARTRLTREEVQANVKTWLEQIQPILDFKDADNPVQVVYNHDWLAKMTWEEIIELSANFTVQQMLERDMFEKRMNEGAPIYLHEFFYPLMQGYDSVVLEVDAELCGTDQTFNALAGRTLLKRLKNKEKFVIVTTLLENPKTGEKMMSKSLGTGVYLNEVPNEMYGKIMAQPDENLLQLFTDCTYVTLDEIASICKDMETGANPRDYKMRLAREIVTIYHGAESAAAAEAYFVKTIQNKEMPDEVEERIVPSSPISIIDALVETGLASSKSEARRLVEQGGVKVGGTAVASVEEMIDVPAEGVVVQKGKHTFVRLIRK